MNYVLNHYKIDAGTKTYLAYTKLKFIPRFNTARSTRSSKKIPLLSTKHFSYLQSLRKGIDLTQNFKAQTVLLYSTDVY